MNRIVLCDVSKTKKPSPKLASLSRTSNPLIRSQDSDHSIFVPLHYESNYSYPVIVWLHGSNDDERQLKKIMPLVSMRNYVGIGVCGTELVGGDRASGLYEGYSWNQNIESILESQTKVNDCLTAAHERFNIRPDRVFLAGFGDGGTMALRIGLMNPEKFAGVASIGGGLPRHLQPFSRINAARSLQVMIAQGKESDEYTTDQLCDDLRMFHRAGMTVTLRQYPCGQEVNTAMLSAFDSWVMEIVSGRRAEIEQTYSTENRN